MLAAPPLVIRQATLFEYGPVLHPPKYSSMIRTAAWEDVRRKAVRLRSSGQIKVVGHEKSLTIAEVRGDHGTYTVKLFRMDPRGNKIVTWSCSCPWGYWAFRRQYQYRGRVCSHALAVFYEARSMDYADMPENREFDQMYIPDEY